LDAAVLVEAPILEDMPRKLTRGPPAVHFVSPWYEKKVRDTQEGKYAWVVVECHTYVVLFVKGL
jgi:hypothetical protein